MLKIRIIPTLLFKEFELVKGIKFDSWRRVGSAMTSVKIYNIREVDELIFLNIAATLNDHKPDLKLIDELADECFMPFTVGGGIKTIEDIRNLLMVGADKVAINTAAVLNPGLISEAAQCFGSQCIVVSIDAKKINGEYKVFINSGTKMTEINPVSFAKKVEKLGAGEILLTSIDRDGTFEGYDIELIKSVSKEVSIPVIASGGAGNYEHMLQVLKNTTASAVAAASIFHFTQQTPLGAKKFLKNHGINVRL
jgi:cyclase